MSQSLSVPVHRATTFVEVPIEVSEALERSPALWTLLLRYALAFQQQVTQTAACNGHHALDQSLARSLLFQQAGLIRYGHGKIAIADREELEATACECYGAVRHQFERLLGAGRG